MIFANIMVSYFVKEPYMDLPQTDVPKNIFQIWIGPNPIPERFIEARKTIIKMNPTWNYYFFDTEKSKNFVSQNFPNLLDIYLDYPYDIQRADAIRYMLLYVHGGIYLDLDFVAQKSFDSIILGKYDTGLLPSANNTEYITNSWIISKPKSPFLLDILKKLEINIIPPYSIGKHLIVMNSTGPMMISKIYKKHKKQVKIFTNVATKCSICDISRNECKPKNTDYIIPIEGNSWHAIDSIITNFIFCLFN